MRFPGPAFRHALLALFLGLASAATARADVWLLDVLALRSGAAARDADAYVGALALIARRHGAARVDGLREISFGPGPSAGRIVGLWRFADERALDSLLADPAYLALGSLRDRTFDPEASLGLERARFRTRASATPARAGTSVSD